MKVIARILLHAFPPQWLASVIVTDAIAVEYIPDADRQAMEWLEPELSAMLMEVASEQSVKRNADFRKRLGDAGEHLIIESKVSQGIQVTHAASISDSLGYDVEAFSIDGRERELIEVKATLGDTSGTFHISRNECEKAKLYGEQWKLVLVAFNATAFWKGKIRKSDIISVRTLPNDVLLSLTDRDTDYFRWESSAQMFVPDSVWTIYSTPLPEHFYILVGHAKRS
ncbi:DUF3883 domain-containing protein [Burkholderia ubonensis]|uniref:DUF3883 domain-containing protein n=1 Tax=Burkholderia ubonensis TaxID=101571 RepID=UPI0018E001EA|nr:DUF3883 domain-containing protein [Burkholderia ubonensis]